MSDTRWNANVATHLGVLFVGIKKDADFRQQGKVFYDELWQFPRDLYNFFFLQFLSFILAYFIMFDCLGTFCAIIFPNDKKHFCDHNLFDKWV